MVSTTAPPAPSNQLHETSGHATARALALAPRRAVLREVRTWAAGHPCDVDDLAAMDRVFAALAEAEHGPNFDLAMRAARRRVIVHVQQRRRDLNSRRSTI
ncbi:MAG: hypothetical protein OXP73_02635 [Chloroflexota bacterium]|nr:hypothetical protein [Chloroflexota bacterium]